MIIGWHQYRDGEPLSKLLLITSNMIPTYTLHMYMHTSLMVIFDKIISSMLIIEKITYTINSLVY